LLAALPAAAAERLVFSYGPMEFYLSVASLEAYAKEGTVAPDLAFYLRFIKPEDQPELRAALSDSRPLKPFAVSQVLYTPGGQTVLQNLGDLFQTTAHQNGLYALRAAMIQSAADPGGISALGVLRHFPSQDVRVSIPSVLHLARDVKRFVDQTTAVVQEIEALSKAAAQAEGPLDLASLPPVSSPGPLQFTKQTWSLRDTRRERDVPTDVYVPVFPAGQMPTSLPVVVFSHGLWETREFVAPFLELLASYGFVAVAPEHIGSDKGQQDRLLNGEARTGAELSEFYDRPLDVSFVLDTLEQKNASDFAGRLNLKQVGVLGHSFGGYTVLVLGGATVDFPRLRQTCQKDYILQSLNSALVLECQALRLESSPEAVEKLTSGQLKDPRVTFVVAVSPVTNAIFGPSGIDRIQVPVVLVGGGNDPATPVVPEQAEAFTWLTTTDKYLFVSNDLSHTPKITELIGRLTLPEYTPQEFQAKLDIFLQRFRGIGLAFMQVYVAGKPEYRPYLQSAYTQNLKDPPFEFSLIRSFPPEKLDKLLHKTR
jgi:predicted dienelactone hydrolase